MTSLARSTFVERNKIIEPFDARMTMKSLMIVLWCARSVQSYRSQVYHPTHSLLRMTAFSSSPYLNSHAKVAPTTTTESSRAAQVHVYPYGTKNLSTYSHTKTVHYIRHAQGYHNVRNDHHNPNHVDARLTDMGKQQCRSLAQEVKSARPGSPLHDLMENAQLLITSPLTRCIQTTLYSMEPLLKAKPHLQVMAHEGIRETVNYYCDKRRHVDETASDFAFVDFSYIDPAHDAIWERYETRLGHDYSSYRESAEIHVVAQRGRDFLHWLQSRDEDHVVICSHAAFSRCFWNFGLPGKQASDVEQTLDDRGHNAKDIPLFEYKGDEDFANTMRADFENCELRSAVFAFVGDE